MLDIIKIIANIFCNIDIENMDIKEKLNIVYKFYTDWQFEQAKEVNDQILQLEPNNIYAKRYDSFLITKITFANPWKTVKAKGKTMKCPHCVSKIALSSMTQEQIGAIKSWNYNNLELKCPYCHTSFVLQKKKANSILWLKIWHKVELEGVKYRIVWYAEYFWRWFEWSYHGKTEYLEWILLWEDNSYKYFSEWYSIDEWRRDEEFEFSHKITPDFSIDADYSWNRINISGRAQGFSWTCKIKVKSVYWENSKSYTIWENVELYEFKHWWKNYVIEKEWAWRQMEAWVYETTTLSKSKALKVFNLQWVSQKKENYKNSVSTRYDNDDKANAILKLMIFVPLSFIILTFVIFKPLFWLFQPNVKIGLKDVVVWTFDLKYDIDAWIVTKTVKYDYGWVKSYYIKKEWIKFLVETKDDLEIIEKLNNMSSWEEELNTSQEKTRRYFQDWIIYKTN